MKCRLEPSVYFQSRVFDDIRIRTIKNDVFPSVRVIRTHNVCVIYMHISERDFDIFYR